MFINYLRFCAPRANCTISSSLRRNFITSQSRNKVLVAKTQTKPYVLLFRRCHQQQQKQTFGNATKTQSSTNQVKVKLKKGDFTRIMGLMRKEKLVLAAAIGCLIISSGISMSVPFALGRILDMVFEKNDDNVLSKLKNFSIILTAIFIVGGIANFGRVYLFNSASLRIVQQLRAKVYNTMLKQETGWFDTKGTGELLNRLMNDTYIMGQSLSQNVSDGLRSITMLTAGTSMMIYTSPELALVSSVVVPCMAGVAIFYGRYVRKITRTLLDRFAELSKTAEERLGNVKTVKTFCKENDESALYQSKLDEAMTVGYQEVRARSIFFGLTGFSGNVIILTVICYGGNLVVQESLSIGALTSFLLYAAYSGISINGLTNFYTELNKGIGAAQRIWDIMDRQYKIPLNVGLVPSQPPKGELIFKNVSFNFPTRPESHILQKFNLVLSPGQTTAIVGRSGSGKSTIASLVLRLYDPLEGQILLDGTDLCALNPLWLRSHIGAVSQEPVLFSGTIRDNILYGLRPGAAVNEEHLAKVIKQAHVDEFVAQLPQGLNTLVGQRGTLLSGGQRQRVAIARALIKNPTILVLDEATSALDSMSEALVQDALLELAKGRTVLTIAHRLSTIRNAHKIAVLDHGIIREQGSYEDLIRQNEGAFKELVAKQAFQMNS